MRILLVEDDKVLANTLAEILEKKGYETTICYNYMQAYHEIEHAFDCFLLDQILPDGNGLDLCRLIREKSASPILIISSDTAESSILKGFALEADDYIEKPFRLNVFLAKIESVLRRSGKLDKEITIGDFRLSTELKILSAPNQDISLTVTESAILENIFRFFPHIASRQQITRNIFDRTNKITSAQTLNVRLSELRKKLGIHSSHLEAIPNSGLRWKE
ncbi:response regulator transcription factor [Faecalitalea cylindroides]|uniref:response regulator transcription factor n=1 Tax=Faecalitalea cylindroides TaxID=39483 RepID=UPI001959A046|nr:response regulator transcription factor [Faecalitalea cylindroides]MBM6810381.1 response regulator transcription factor [Faecalitalea cylindroides]